MQTINRFVKLVGLAVCITAAIPVYAESAPVYDADSMQQSDNGYDQAPDLQAGPQEGGFGAGPAASPPGASNLSLDQRVQRVEQQISNMQNTETSARTDSLQEQVQSLRGQVESLTHQIQQIQTQQASMYTDLDKRLAQNNTAKPLPPAPAESNADQATKPTQKSIAAKAQVKPVGGHPETLTPADQPNVAEEQQIYQTAYNLIKAKKYNEAVTALQSMLKKYPTGQFAANAHYWLGELYGMMGKNDQALIEFSNVVKTYPDSPRVSDAQLKVGLILASQLKWPDAKVAFKRVINSYSGTASARLAAEQIKQLRQAGH